MRTIVLLIGVLTALFITIYGALFAWASPELALWFHDTFADRSKRSKNADWRREVGNAAYRMMGVVLFVIGLFFCFALLSRLPSTLQ